jgi:uncharacterized protein with von Willebrand factor type A (vWA) domain
MITNPAAIKREVLQLIDLQIETLKQESSLDSSELNEYQARSERIRKLYEALDSTRADSFAEEKGRGQIRVRSGSDKHGQRLPPEMG